MKELAQSTNVDAARATLAALHAEERLIELDSARETAFLAIAERLDAFPGNALLWGQYLALEAELRRTDDGNADAEFWADLRSKVGIPKD